MKKRRQHYVWRHYLEQWVSDKNRVRCILNGKLRSAGTRDLAVEMDYYRLKPLNEEEVAFLLQLVDRSPVVGREALLGWVNTFKSVSDIHAASERLPSRLPSDEQVFDEALNNLEEDYRTAVEKEGMAYLDSLRQGNADFFSNRDDFNRFIYFLSLQYFRTEKMTSATAAAAHLPPGARIANIWPVLRHVFATNLGASFAGQRAAVRIAFLQAGAGLDLLTGDQPVINSCAIGKKPGSIPADFRYYYPVTPTRAVLVSASEECKSVPLSEEEVRFYNRGMFLASQSQVYGIRDATLLEACTGAHEA